MWLVASEGCRHRAAGYGGLLWLREESGRRWLAGRIICATFAAGGEAELIGTFGPATTAVGRNGNAVFSLRQPVAKALASSRYLYRREFINFTI
ncbi:hypothetical protein GCM10011378_12790 [Hymenobacter glacieicola]|uniref:Uncharacterized protein n=1 Tax=Hymenobacter glacieicola TaxID=1562124 RepID=A0ABQ1WQ25_9BACT|nr:hypothetical protein GCM10011378_12790 [Hymenobacter glacieicola]